MQQTVRAGIINRMRGDRKGQGGGRAYWGKRRHLHKQRRIIPRKIEDEAFSRYSAKEGEDYRTGQIPFVGISQGLMARNRRVTN